MSPLDKSRGGTPTGERAQKARAAPQGAEVTEQRPIGVPPPVFYFSFLRGFVSSLRGAKRRSNPKFTLESWIASLRSQ
jgi:hypothetical protein